MVSISAELLASQAEATGFRTDVLEKVVLLIRLLEAMRGHPFLKGKLALKGGTALNLFIFDVPRLSIDIDLNYVGAPDRETMLAERAGIESAMKAVFSREGFAVGRLPDEHAGGKWRLRYRGASGRGGTLEVDVNFMFRTPLWPVKLMDSKMVGTWKAGDILVMDVHELAAGKIAALLSRKQARDLFDCRQLFRSVTFDPVRLRVAFVVYGAMNRRDWRTVSIEEVTLEIRDYEQKLVPMLRVQDGNSLHGDFMRKGLIEDCRCSLGALLPLTMNEKEFLDHLLERGEIHPELLTSDAELQERILRHPLLEWKALNVRNYRGIGN